ncbi:hypothetical protein IL306_007004 [Fusarium sp. DS 682]|nr:hypothetical protein IL306_007004 [Fusarium sp. DS 682]
MRYILTNLGHRNANAPAETMLKVLRVHYVVGERRSAPETSHAAPVSSSVLNAYTTRKSRGQACEQEQSRLLANV